MPIPVLAPLIGAGINAGIQALQNKSNRKWELKMYERQRMDNLADWTSQKEYDSPAAQMERLKKAGLNPNLVYGGGNTLGSGGSPATAKMGSPDTAAPQVDTADFTKTLLSTIDQERLEAQKDVMEQQIAVMEQDKIQKAAQTAAIIQGTEGSKFELSQKMRLADTNFEQMVANVNKTRADTEYTIDQNDRAAAQNASTLREAVERILASRQNRAKSQVEIQHIKQQIEASKQDIRLKEYDEELQKQGIPRNSPGWWSAIAKFLSSLGEMPPKERQRMKKIYGDNF